MAISIIRTCLSVVRTWVVRLLFVTFFPPAKVSNGDTILTIPFHIDGIFFNLEVPYGMDYMDTYDDLALAEERGNNIKVPRLIYEGRAATIVPPPKGGEVE